ncbi:pancreatic secretory granule membrane major glycoprotein GP2-like [Astyanax mexicanus]|uniref:Pancreatic secretory granule membrane major glycoprotein GP2-like n=1 Tax=Astyanax mexicanus TaxID=7994 RepID=A0A8T2KUV1_ASTMX|nr:pancreatic secretory granule membrane major glycoprotein GP2-like [Astyanax mexicanus]
MSICDDNFNWNGWYRLLYNGMNIRMPESCINYNRCGTFATFWLNGSHPQISDGIITRQACGSWINNCCTWSVSIRLKACKGNYYIYEFVKPNVCIAAYCADVNSITPVTDPMKMNSTTAPVVVNTPSYDPCSNYISLDQSWRGTNETGGSNCDRSTNWNGWYRLLYNGMSTQMPESCINVSRCGTNVPLWLSGSHPQISDGIVTRWICGNFGSDCCHYRSFPIRVKACKENYYVYEFVKTSFCTAAYCADVNPQLPISATTGFFYLLLFPNHNNECGSHVFNYRKNSVHLPYYNR